MGAMALSRRFQLTRQRSQSPAVAAGPRPRGAEDADEESTGGPAADEQQATRAANWRGSSAVADWSTGHGAAAVAPPAAIAGQAASSSAAATVPPAAIAEQAASSSAVAAHAGVDDPMAAPSSILPYPQGIIPYEVFRNELFPKHWELSSTQRVTHVLARRNGGPQ